MAAADFQPGALSTPPPPPPSVITKIASEAAAAAAAVALSRVPCYPLDTLKCKLQVLQLTHPQPIQLCIRGPTVFILQLTLFILQLYLTLFVLQASSSASGAAMPFKSVIGAIRHTYLHEGIVGFYRGFGVALTGVLHHPFQLHPYYFHSSQCLHRNHTCWHHVRASACFSAIASRSPPATSCPTTSAKMQLPPTPACRHS
jgi:hypothetical protein